MSTDERRLQTKVGILVLLALAGGLGLLALMGELRFSWRANLIVNFSHTGNVVVGAPVKLGGITVGRVESIKLVADRRDEFGAQVPVEMSLNLDDEALGALRQDAAVTVATQGPLGEAYLEMYIGSPSKPLWDKKSTIRGVDAPRLDLVANRLSAFLESASRVLENNPEALQSFIGGIATLTSTMDTLLKENRGDLKTLTSELSEAATDLRQLSSVARKNFEPGGNGSRLLEDGAFSAKVLREQLPDLSQKAGVALGGLVSLSKDITDEDGVRLRNALLRMDRIADRGDRLLAKLESGEGTAGAVLKDPKVYEDLKELIKDLRQHPWKILWKE